MRSVVRSLHGVVPPSNVAAPYGQAFLHEKCGMMHRDLKFQNVLVATMPTYDTKGVFKITDFGISTACGNHTTICGTPGAPTA